MAYIETNRPISAIFSDLVSQFTTLIRKEGQLARAEMSEKLGEIGIALGLAVGGAVLLIPALVILLEHAQEMAAHESPRTTKLYDRTKERLTQD
jgi:hypothetical protein